VNALFSLRFLYFSLRFLGFVLSLVAREARETEISSFRMKLSVAGASVNTRKQREQSGAARAGAPPRSGAGPSSGKYMQRRKMRPLSFRHAYRALSFLKIFYLPNSILTTLS
jgi:hypothetical protein